MSASFANTNLFFEATENEIEIKNKYFLISIKSLSSWFEFIHLIEKLMKSEQNYTCFDYLQIIEDISKNFITLIRRQIFVLVLWCGMVRPTVYFRKICCYISILFIFFVLDNLFVGSKKLNIYIVEKVLKVTKNNIVLEYI